MGLLLSRQTVPSCTGNEHTLHSFEDQGPVCVYGICFELEISGTLLLGSQILRDSVTDFQGLRVPGYSASSGASSSEQAAYSCQPLPVGIWASRCQSLRNLHIFFLFRKDYLLGCPRSSSAIGYLSMHTSNAVKDLVFTWWWCSMLQFCNQVTMGASGKDKPMLGHNISAPCRRGRQGWALQWLG